METKFHYSPRTESAAPCRSIDRCPYRKTTEHFFTRSEAEEYAEKENARKYGNTTKLQKIITGFSLEQQRDALKSLKEHCRINRKDETFATKEDLTVFTNLIKNEINGENLQSQIEGEDEAFSKGNFSFNSVEKVFLQNGKNGYFKGIDQTASTYYGTTVIRAANNEVAAYKLSQALGGTFATLVPETTIRYYDGQIGTIQEEAVGTIGSISEPILLGKSNNRFQAAAFDYISGAQDRHGGNFIHKNPPPEIKLIDNGFSFPEEKDFYTHASHIVNLYIEDFDTDEEFNETIDAIQNLVKSPDGLGMKKYLSPKAFDNLMERSKLYVESMEKYKNQLLK